MEIVTVPNPILRKECEDVDIKAEPDLEQFVKDLSKIMYNSNGCGIAAPQVGVSKKIVVIDIEYGQEKKNPIYLINPRIENTSGEEVIDEEGCLSVPGITVSVVRPEKAFVVAQDLNGDEFEIDAEGFLARCLQHEIDHLHGITMLEHLNVMDRIAKLEEYKAAIAAGAAPGQTTA